MPDALQRQPNDTKGETFDAVARVTAEGLLGLDPGPDAQYLLCGSERFLSELRSDLECAGVSQNHIHFEAFGPSG